MKKLERKKILIISPESWEHDFVSKHHYAIHLASRGNEVYFLNPPSSKTVIRESGYKRLFIIDYKPLFRGLNKLPWLLSRRLWKYEVKRLEKLTGRIDVVWTFDPFRFQNLICFLADINIYFAADFHMNRKAEKIIADQSDLVLAPSQALISRIETSTRKMKINHAVADYFFTDSEAQATNRQGKVRVGYVGNLESRYLHQTLLKEVITHNQNCDFIFVSAITGTFAKELSHYANVVLKGRAPNDQVPAILNDCDVMLLCYDTDRFRMEASNAHKVMEYLATGKVVVSTRLAEYETAPELVLMPAFNNELPQFLSSVISHVAKFNSRDNANARISLARVNTYESQIKYIESQL